MADADELTAIAAELLATPIDEFTAKRNDRVRELKRSGAAALAAEVQKLRRPTVPLWAVNQLAAQRDVLAAVREASLAAADAQSQGAASDLRDALGRHRRALDVATHTAAEILQSSGHSATDDTRLKVRELVRLAALDDADWERLARGALVEEPNPDVGFGPLPEGAAQRATSDAAPPKASHRTDERRVREDPERRVREARRAAADDARAAEQAELTAKHLREQAAKLRERAESAERRAIEAEEAATRARMRATASQAALKALGS
jgi:hypothetical protein